MRKLILFFITLTITSFSYSQKFSLGPKAGLNLSNLIYEGEFSEHFRFKLNYHFGAEMDLRLSNHLSLGADLLYTGEGHKDKVDIYQVGSYNFTTYMYSLKLPIYLKVFPSSNRVFHLSFGVQPGLFLFGKNKIEYNGEVQEYKLDRESMRTFQLDVPIGLGLNFKNGFNTDLRVYHGLINSNIDESAFSKGYRIFAIQLSASYRFLL